MAVTEKIIWVVNYNTLTSFLNKAVAVGATGVAIRTDNDVQTAIDAFHAKGIKVYGWRWPSAQRDPAMKEAAKVVGLLNNGLDGYFVDPEGERGKPYDWDQKNLKKLAHDFCSTIKGASVGKIFGTTSHYRAADMFPSLPWSEFFSQSDVLLPQAYWRSTEGTIGHGIPADNYKVSIDFWTKAGGDPAKIVPMGGELAVSLADDIVAHAAAATSHGIKTLHFFSYTTNVSAAVWDAVKNA